MNDNFLINSYSEISQSEQLDNNMTHLLSSNNPEDIATVGYIWGFPLVNMERQFNYATNANTPPGVGIGHANTISCAKELVDASFTLVVSPNSDTLYCIGNFNLKDEPIVLQVPSIKDRYFTFQFVDAYTNDFAYVGTRATGNNGGTYLLAGPQWIGDVPEGVMKIWSPTNLVWLINRILVTGQDDISNVHEIQDKIIVKPLSLYLGKNINSLNNTTNSNTTQLPIEPKPSLIAPTGTKIFDELGVAMAENPPNPPDPVLVAKLASIGIGPGKTPSTSANQTIQDALQKGITKGQNMINAEVANIGTLSNGWMVNPKAGVFGDDYLFRAAIAQKGLGANIAQEALYPFAFIDSDGNPLNGENKYLIHFNPGQIPPVDAFWSITMYNSKSLFVDNPINRYSIGKYTYGLKNNTDGSLDIYIQTDSPGTDKESNWLPSPAEENFSMVMRLYLPQHQIFDGTWEYPSIKKIE